MGTKTRTYGITIGEMETGRRNQITDVPGVKVGHQTLTDGDTHTGVTVILPHEGNLFKQKLLAASHVINGFGKTTGLIQVEEMGTLETPVALTNTFAVGRVYDALVDYSLERNPEIGRTTGTVNPLVGECNDMHLNDIRNRSVAKEDVWHALRRAENDFEEGSVGAGTGMVCYSMKGGIGSASRKIDLAYGSYTLGVLTLTNFGTLSDLRIDGRSVGKELSEAHQTQEKDRGSVMVICATDLPVTERQLKRILKRAAAGLSRTGSIIGNGSGEVVIGFTTAGTIPHDKPDHPLSLEMLHEEDIDAAFRAVRESCEEAVLESLLHAEPGKGRNGHYRPTLPELLEKFNFSLQ
ncbi:P1 family peptidase [Halobacillus kuroshimensis]|uniref:P1 family peptidase n=1 Tax=Halobacillus kuroshimensis TaxID=302481 RepID=A0ABS3DY79_9BACI|nr:P1 family peptidase [Halobacillus kuroshimensis]MBN8236292.1 P1 family peptidase [Halobacillus kuroshimensis]